MINQHTKLEASIFTHYEYIKGNAKCRNWGGLGVRVTQGHWQCHHSIKCIWLPYSTLIRTVHLPCTVFE